jgi:hypothetical protein
MGEGGGAYGNGAVKELITRGQADAVFTALLILGVILAPLAWFIARRRGGMNPAAAALAWGGAPALVGVLWRVYNAIADGLGPDTVKNLAVNLALFVAVGAACGALWSRVTAGNDAPAPAEGEPEGAAEP